MDRVDVVVFGGGPAGSAAAITLCKRGLSVVVIERTRYESRRPGELFAPAVRAELSALGVWEQFCGSGFIRSPGIVSAWGGATPYEKDFVTGLSGPGWHVDRRDFDTMMATAASGSGARILTGTRMVNCRRRRAGWIVEGVVRGRPAQISAHFLIDATGRTAWLAKRLGHRRTVHDRLVALGGVSSTPEVGDRRAHIEACSDGWWYSAHLPNKRQIAVFMTDADLLSRSAGAAERWRRRDGAPLTRSLLNGRSADVEFRIVTASTSTLDTFTDTTTWLAIGDAAMACDPLCGSGVVSALASGRAAGEAVGHPLAVAAIAAHVPRHFDRYRRLQRIHYGMEDRWPDQIFWLRRRAGRHEVIAATQ